MRHFLVCVFVLTSICLTAASRLAAAPSDTLDNDSIIQMVRWNFKDSEIIADIGRSQTNFDLSPSTISILTANGVSEAVLNAMFDASKRSSKMADVGSSGGITPTNKQPSTPPTTKPPPTTPSATDPSATVIPAHTHTPQRLAEAIGTTAATPPICDAHIPSNCVPPYHVPCPLANNGKAPNKTISLYFPSSTSDPTRVDDSGAVCFEIYDFNDILYTASFQVKETAPTGSAWDYLQDAIKAVTGFSSGGATTNLTAAAAKTAAAPKMVGGVPPPQPVCPAQLIAAITTAQGAAARFGAALSGIDPGKDSSGNINLVDWRTTTFKWQPIPGAYQQFEAAVSQVIASLQLKDVDVCTDDVKAEAEAIVVDTYLPARDAYTSLASHVASDHVVRMTSQLHSTSSYTVTVQAVSPSGTVANGTKTFSLAAGRTILSSSGGFLITELPSTSYSSVTAPTGMTTPPTQNVLAVTNPKGPSLGLVALLNIYLPNIMHVPLSGHDWGLALSAGPTYNLSNGKADTSKFGLFAGVSLHIRSQLFLTPGVNIGEYSGWPVGFSSAGQVIPPNTGTPMGVNRWSTRFGFTITYKIKDFGQSTTPTSVTPAPAPAATPQTKSPKTN